MVEGGKTPVQSADELGARGFRIVIFPGGTARAVAHTLQGYYAQPARSTRRPRRGATAMLDFDELNAVIGTPELLARQRVRRRGWRCVSVVRTLRSAKIFLNAEGAEGPEERGASSFPVTRSPFAGPGPAGSVNHLIPTVASNQSLCFSASSASSASPR